MMNGGHEHEMQAEMKEYGTTLGELKNTGIR